MVIYGQLAGEAPIFSVNFDMRFAKRPDGFGFRAGVGGLLAENSGFINIPVGVNHLLGGKGHYFESGVGVSYVAGDISLNKVPEADYYVLGNLTVGYRYQKPGTLSVRAGFTPMFGKGFIVPWGGVGVGFTLR